MSDTAFLVAELVVLFLGVSLTVELLQRRLGSERIRRWMGGRPIVAALKGIAVGFVTPFCTYSAVPLLIGFRRAGVPTAGWVAFVVAAPVLDPILFGALTLIVGFDVALAYLATAFAAALTLALITQRIGIDHRLRPLPSLEPVASCPGTPATTPSCGPPDAAPWRGWDAETRLAARGAGRLLRSFGPLLLAGIAIGLAIEAYVSPDTVAQVTGQHSTFAIPVAAALGTPLYFSTELFVPIADALHGAGVGTGAIVALTIAGAGANVPEFVILARMAQRRVVAAFFGYVFAVAMIGGSIAGFIG